MKNLMFGLIIILTIFLIGCASTTIYESQMVYRSDRTFYKPYRPVTIYRPYRPYNIIYKSLVLYGIYGLYRYDRHYRYNRHYRYDRHHR